MIPPKTFFKAGAGIILLAYCGNYFYSRYQEIQHADIALNYRLIFFAVAFNLSFYLIINDSWQYIVVLFSKNKDPLPPIAFSQIFFISFISRYLPAGQLFAHGGRVEWLNRYGRERPIGVASIIYEQIYLLGGVLLLAGLGVLFYPINMFPKNLYLPRSTVAFGAFLFSITCFFLPEWILLIFARLQGPNDSLSLLAGPSFMQKVALVFRYVLINALQGLAAYFTLLAALSHWPISTSEIVLVMSAYPLSRLVGQMAVFVPSGLGVREGVFVVLIGSIFPLQSVLACALLMRFSGIIIELLLVSIFTVALR